jgi:uncharacterized protein (TIGR02001 family)
VRHGAEAGQPNDRARAWLAALALCCAWLWPMSNAHAQVSGSLGAVSDYRYRGYSLSDGDPALQGSIAYDAASGAYGGLFASTTRDEDSSGIQWIPYAGIARRDQGGRSWDVGVRYVHFDEASEYDYVEAHVGVAFRRLTVRLHLSPDYYGAVPNAYLEADAHFPLGERVRLLLHAGLSHSGDSQSAVYVPTYDYYSGPGGYYATAEGDATRLDVSAGIAVRTALCDVQASWQHVDGSDTETYATPWDPNNRSGFVLGCVRRW